MIVTTGFLDSIKLKNNMFSRYQNKYSKHVFGKQTKLIAGEHITEEQAETLRKLRNNDGKLFREAVKKIKQKKQVDKRNKERSKYRDFVEKNKENAVSNGDAILITKDLYRKNRSGKSKMQEVLAKPYGGVNKLIGQTVGVEFWERWKAAGFTTASIKNSAIKLNPISKPEDWNWKPENGDIPKLKSVSTKGNKNSGRRKKNKLKVSRKDNEDFYTSKEWRALRVRVLEKYECKCMMCGRSPKLHNVVIHVDHIKPRSKHPELSLDFDNLQLLCEDCNLGKSNRYETDWRPTP